MLNIKSANGFWAVPALRGMSAYQVAVKNGFEGTEAEWLNSLHAAPLILNADSADEYPENSAWGDRALKAIQEGRQILVRVPNADGGNYPAIYSPVLMYQLPNYENNYLYLFYLRDEKQDLSALLGQAEGTVQMPQYGELKMLLSETYNGSPLGQPYINTSPAVGGAAAKPVFVISCSDGSEVSLVYCDNPERKVTAQELVDMYFAGNGYHTKDPIRGGNRISAVFAVSGSINVSFGSETVGVNNINNSDFEAAMAKYLP